MRTEFPRVTFDSGDLAVLPNSQLDTLAHLNPVACVQFADVLLRELKGAMATCTIDAPTTSLANSFEQIHALKNMVSPTGCAPLLAACAALQSRSANKTHREELRSEFNEIVQATQSLITTYRSSLVASKPT